MGRRLLAAGTALAVALGGVGYGVAQEGGDAVDPGSPGGGCASPVAATPGGTPEGLFETAMAATPNALPATPEVLPGAADCATPALGTPSA